LVDEIELVFSSECFAYADQQAEPALVLFVLERRVKFDAELILAGV
jgi:hypothetical protein